MEYHVEAEVVSPVHITGESVLPHEYYVAGGVARVVDVLSGNVDLNALKMLKEFMENSGKNPSNFQKMAVLRNFPVKRTIMVDNVPTDRFDGMLGEGKYVPGSSIKGSIRVSWIRKRLLEEGLDEFLSKYSINYQRHNRGGRLYPVPPFPFDDLEKYPGDDFPHRDRFRGLSVSDGIPENGALKTALLPMHRIEGKEIYAEFLLPGQKFTFTISIDENVFSINDIVDSLEKSYEMVGKIERHVPEVHGTPLIIGRFTGIFSKTVLSLVAEGIDVSPFMRFLRPEKVKRAVSKTAERMDREAPLYVEFSGRKFYPGVISLKIGVDR